jgi:hypothetical protein
MDRVPWSAGKYNQHFSVAGISWVSSSKAEDKEIEHLTNAGHTIMFYHPQWVYTEP